MVLMCLSAFTFAQQKQPGSSALTTQDKQRIAVKQQWIEKAKKIANQTQDPEAKAITDFVFPYILTVAPVNSRGDVKFLEAATPNKPWFQLLPLLASDKTMLRGLPEFQTDRHSFARYDPDSKTIFVSTLEPYSDFWKGLMLLHEADHAGASTYQPYDWHNPQIFSEKERDVHEFQNRLSVKIGGFAYDQLLRKEKTRIRNLLQQRGLKPGMAQAGMADYYPELDKIFTPAQSRFEQLARQTSFWIHANFELLDETYGKGPEAERRKALFLYTGYKKEGILK